MKRVRRSFRLAVGRELLGEALERLPILLWLRAAPPVPMVGHRLSFTSALRGFFTRSPLSPRTPRQSPGTSPRTSHSNSSITPRPRWSTSSHENPYFPPTSAHVSHSADVASTARLYLARPSRPRSTSAPTGDLPTLQKKGFLARIRLKLGHSGEPAVTRAAVDTAVVPSGSQQPSNPIPPKIPPFRRAASGPARLLDRNHREQQRRVCLWAIYRRKKQPLTLLFTESSHHR